MRWILSLLAIVAASAAANPLPIGSDLLHTRFMLEQHEPSVWSKDVQFAFLPEGASVRSVYKNGDEIVGERRFGDVELYGALAILEVRGIGTIPLGSNDGPRSIEFFVDDQLVYTLGFTLTKETTGDAFSPRTLWRIAGPWSDLAYFTYDPERGPGEPINLVFWVGGHEASAGSEVVAIIRRGGAELARTAPRTVQGAGYDRFQQDLLIGDRSRMTAGELSAFDGDLTLDIEVAGTVLRSFAVWVQAGAFVPNQRSDHTAVPAASFLAPRYVVDNNQVRGGLSSQVLTWVSG